MSKVVQGNGIDWTRENWGRPIRGPARGRRIRTIRIEELDWILNARHDVVGLTEIARPLQRSRDRRLARVRSLNIANSGISKEEESLLPATVVELGKPDRAAD